MDIPKEADYIIVGGGLTGCALASRLASLSPGSSILLLEAGPPPETNPNTTAPMASFALHGSKLDWAYSTEPSPTCANRVISIPSGKTLGGGSVLNYGGWARGDRSDYDEWPKIVGDKRWSYEGLLPHMKRSERLSAEDADPKEHGLKGPIKVTGVRASDRKRKYPLREPIRKAWEELGAELVPSSAGKLAGLSEFLENWDNGVRQPAHLAYNLADVEVKTETLVGRVVFESSPGQPPRASGVSLADGSEVKARKEVIVTAGAYRSPQLLQLSGIGPAELLARHSIPLVYDSPGVGSNLFDHFAMFQVFKLRGPERGLALGHPSLSDPAFVKGFPVDWIFNEALPTEELQRALAEDGDFNDVRSLGKAGRSHVETMVMYLPYAPGIPFDGSHIASSVMLTLPTSRGTVNIASSSPADAPLIEPNYFATAVDRAVLSHGVHRLLQCFSETAAGKDIVEGEVALVPGLEPLTAKSIKAEIEEHIRLTGGPHAHPAGSCALGTVLDADLRVKGVSGLRVVDASVFPAPVGGHPQATLYGIAEMAATIVAGKDH